MTFRLPKVSQREWMFLIGGAVLGYVVVPRIFHHIGVGDTGPEYGNEAIPGDPRDCMGESAVPPTSPYHTS